MARLLVTRLPTADLSHGHVNADLFNRFVRVLELNLQSFDPTATYQYTNTIRDQLFFSRGDIIWNLTEDNLQVLGTPHIALESTNIIQSEGQIPLDNWTLNSSTSPIGYQPVVHASEIRVRTTGDIALEDSTDTTYGYLVLNGTDGSSTNAGDNLDCEGGTGIAG